MRPPVVTRLTTIPIGLVRRVAKQIFKIVPYTILKVALRGAELGVMEFALKRRLQNRRCHSTYFK